MRAVIYQGSLGKELSRLIQNGKATGQACCDKRTEVGPALKSAKVNVSKKAWEPQRSAERLAPKGVELREKRIEQLKQIIAKGEYKVDTKEVAKSIVRTEISRYLKKSKVPFMNVDLTELLALTEEEIAAREKMAVQRGGPKEARPSVVRRHVFSTNRCRTRSRLLDFLR